MVRACHWQEVLAMGYAKPLACEVELTVAMMQSFSEEEAGAATIALSEVSADDSMRRGS